MKKNKIRNNLIFIFLYLISIVSYNIKPILNIRIGLLFNMGTIVITILFIILYILDKILKEKFKKFKWLFSISVIIFCIFNSIMPSINILAYILIFYFLMYVTFLTKKLLKFDFEISLGLSIIFFLIVLLILSIMNLLIYTKLFIVLIIILGLIYLIIYYKNLKLNPIEDINNFINLKLLIFALLFIISIINGYERYVHYWDEYNMWALSAKKIIYNNNISNFSYPPIMSLWHYFINTFDSFKEQNLYIGNSIFIYIFIMSIFFNVKEKKLYIPLFIISISFYYLFGDVYSHDNLYADLPSAVVFGFGLILLYKSIMKNGMSKLYLILPCIILTLIKPQGFVLSTVLLFIAMLLYAFKNFKWSFNKKNIIDNILSIIKEFWFIIIPILLYILWSIFSKHFLISNMYITDKIMPNTLLTFLEIGNFSILFKFILNIIKFLDNNIFIGIINLSQFNYFIFINLSIFILLYLKSKNVKKSISYTIPFILGFIAYYLLTSLSLLMKMPLADALNLASFTRYLGNFNVGIFMFLVWLFISEKYFNKNIKNLYLKFAISLMIILSVPISSTLSFITDYNFRVEKRSEMYEIKSKFDVVLNNTSEKSKIYIINQKDEDGYLPMCHASYYLFPRITNANTQINWKLQTKNNPSDWELSGLTLEKTLLKNDFDYLFLFTSTDELFDEIDFMIDNIEQAKKYTLFKIKKVNNSIHLIPIK